MLYIFNRWDELIYKDKKTIEIFRLFYISTTVYSNTGINYMNNLDFYDLKIYFAMIKNSRFQFLILNVLTIYTFYFHRFT